MSAPVSDLVARARDRASWHCDFSKNRRNLKDAVLLDELAARITELEAALAGTRKATIELCARTVETALVDHYEQQHGQRRGNSEAEVFLAQAVRLLAGGKRDG